MKRLIILGSTGSIGQQALDVVRRLPGEFEVLGLAAGRNVDLLACQISEFHPRFFAADRHLAVGGATRLSLAELAGLPGADLALVATVGSVGLAPTFAAIQAGTPIALANKEVLVIAGEIVAESARRAGVPLLPVDSEHNALWQCLEGEAPLGEWSPESKVARLVLTASGGAFRDRSLDSLAGVTPAEALAHPNWQMGPKVTVDSATLLNKGFEVIEARWLFGLPYDRIDVVMHRQSVVHSLVEYVDGSLKAQLGPPDMRLPIQYALTYPKRLPSPVSRLDLATLGNLTFGPLDESRYPCFRLARQAAGLGGTYPAALSGADESAVDLFLRAEIGFLDIARLLEQVLGEHRSTAEPALGDCVAASEWAAARSRELARQIQRPG
jgi:1-deoxy-D-xylulose-5-phosphate reductoisomerase